VYTKRIQTTNIIKRVSKELKRRTNAEKAFPNEDIILRLVGSLLIDINEERRLAEGI